MEPLQCGTEGKRWFLLLIPTGFPAFLAIGVVFVHTKYARVLKECRASVAKGK